MKKGQTLRLECMNAYLRRLTELRFNVPLDAKWVILVIFGDVLPSQSLG